MRFLAIPIHGLESATAKEIASLLPAPAAAKIETKEGAVLFSAEKWEDIVLIAYKAQTILRLLYVFDEFPFADEKVLIQKIKQSIQKMPPAEITQWFDRKTTLAVRCVKEEASAAINKSFIEPKTGGFLLEKIKREKKFAAKVDLENPDALFLAYICKDTCYLGIDVAGIDLSKRSYKIFTHQASLNGAFAAALFHLIDYKPSEKLLLPFIKDGTLAIEAAYYAKSKPIRAAEKKQFTFPRVRPLQKIAVEKIVQQLDKKEKKQKPQVFAFDDSLQNIKAAKKNMKIAQVDFSLSKTEVEELDVLHKKGAFDKAIAYITAKDECKLNELLYQLSYVLKKSATILFLTRKECVFPTREGFVFVDEKLLRRGETWYKISVIKKR